jgi:hypothetical protein
MTKLLAASTKFVRDEDGASSRLKVVTRLLGANKVMPSR